MINNVGMFILKLFRPFRELYLDILSNDARRQKSIIFGLISIGFSILCVAAVYPSVLYGVKGIIFGFTHFLGIFTYFFAIGHIVIVAASAALFFLPFYLWIQGIVFVVRQFTLNKRFIRWLALLFWLASAVGVVWLFCLSMDLIVNPMLNS